MRYCGANTVKALGALLDKIRPAIVLVHSQSGAYGLDLIGQRCRYLAGTLGTAWTTSPARFEFLVTRIKFRKRPETNQKTEGERRALALSTL
jgi:hypothetical protein